MRAPALDGRTTDAGGITSHVGLVDTVRRDDRSGKARLPGELPGTPVDYGVDGGCLLGTTTVHLGPFGATFSNVVLPEIHGDREIGDGWIKLTQTAGAPKTPPVIVTAAETALERELSTRIMRGGRKPKIRRLAAGDILMLQGEPGDALYLLLDGVVTVDVDGKPITELGPGAVIGERAILEHGQRTSTVTVVTAIRVAEASADSLDRFALEELAEDDKGELGPAKHVDPARFEEGSPAGRETRSL